MFHDRIVTGIAYCTVCTALLFHPLAQAQAYKWRDADGRIVYSDQPPPTNIPPANILKNGHTKAIPAPATASETPTANTAPKREEKKAAAPKSAADQELEFKKRQMEKAEAEKKQQQQTEEEKRRQDFCERSKGYLRALESGVRINETSADGAQKIMDDAKRQSEIDDLKKQMAQNKC